MNKKQKQRLLPAIGYIEGRSFNCHPCHVFHKGGLIIKFKDMVWERLDGHYSKNFRMNLPNIKYTSGTTFYMRTK